jgi:ABC-type transport system substrate-binding protein
MAMTRSQGRATRVSLAALSVVASIVAGCGLVSPDRSPAASGAGDLVIGVPNLPLLVGDLEADVLTDHLTYNGLYRYDETYQVLPDLADGLCQQGTDQLTLT